MEKPLESRELTYDERKLVDDAILKARILRPYYGVALSALTPYAVDGLNTIGVDEYWRLYVDPKWFADLEPDVRGNVIAAHEVEHLLRRHPDRARLLAADPAAFNVAGDAEINDDCELELPEGSVTPKLLGQPDGLTAEEYYSSMPTQKVPSCRCGSGSGGKRGEYEKEGEGNGAVSAPEADQLRAATAAAVRDHISREGRGSVPAGIAMWAEEEAKRLRPTWQSVVKAWRGKRGQATSGKVDYSWGRLHRRSQGVLRPSLFRPQPSIALIVDTSGSMSGDGSLVLGAVDHLKTITSSVYDCDAAVQKKRKNAKHMGGGGTDMRVAFDRALKDGAEAIICITDGETPWPAEPKVPTLILLTRAGSKAPKWATSVLIESR